jgi:hypothetical protein
MYDIAIILSVAVFAGNMDAISTLMLEAGASLKDVQKDLGIQAYR